MDQDAKKKLLRWVPSGLYVVGVKSGETLHGFTGSWMSQVSMKPPCVMLGVRTDSKSFEIIKAGKVLVINYIRKENQKTLEHFFKPLTSNGNRLGDYPFETGTTGAPILKEALGYLECKVIHIAEGYGDHAAVIAEVIDAKLRDDVAPLLMSDTPWHYGG